MSSSKFFGSESLAKRDPKHLPPSTGEGRDRGAQKITPTFVLPRFICRSPRSSTAYPLDKSNNPVADRSESGSC